MLKIDVLDLLDPITDICLKLYPNQLNVYQASTQIQYWLNGPDPLDFINVYTCNTINATDDSTKARHYHYVSLGLTDLYGDNRVHQRVGTLDEYSGYGYELTMRIKIESSGSNNDSEKSPPSWPLKLMQALARYTFNTGNLLDVGDHIPNVLRENNNKIKHILVAQDPFLKNSQTKFGKVKFLQLVGCTDDELSIAQQWSASKILNLMKDFQELGGEYLLTDLNRDKSIFELSPDLHKTILKSIKSEGSNLSFVKSNCFWKLGPGTIESINNNEFKSFNEIDIYLDIRSAQLLSIVLKQRLLKEKSFIFNGSNGCNLILVPSNFKNKDCRVNNNQLLKSNQVESQLFLEKKTIRDVYNYLNDIKIDEKDNIQLPIKNKFTIGQRNEVTLSLNIVSNEEFASLV